MDNDITDLFRLTESGVMENSDFLSYYNSVLPAPKNFLEGRIQTHKEGVDKDEVIEAAELKPSHIIIYHLGCSLPIILPFHKTEKTITSFEKAIISRDYTGFIKPKNIAIETPPYYETKQFFGGDKDSKKRLIKAINKHMLGNLLELRKEWLIRSELGNYLISGVQEGDKGFCMSAERTFLNTAAPLQSERWESFSNFDYKVMMSCSNNKRSIDSVVVMEFKVSYKFTQGKDNIYVTISANYDPKKQVYTKSASIELRPSHNPHTSFEFDDKGVISHHNIDSIHRNNDLSMEDGKYLQLLPANGEKSQTIGLLGYIAAKYHLGINPLQQKLNYASSIKNIIQKASEVTKKEELEQFRPLIFRD